MNNNDNKQRSEAGDPIYHHKRRESGVEVPQESRNSKVIDAHITRHFGSSKFVWFEIVSDIVSVDIFVVEPTASRSFYTLITSGMSDLPMNSSDPQFQYAELVMCLPASWPIKNLLDRKRLETSRLQRFFGQLLPRTFPDVESWYWPVRCLKSLARLPHEYKTSLGVGHTIPNGGEKAAPYATNTELCCAFIAPPTPLITDDFVRLETNQKQIWFLSVIPIYKEEMQMKLKQGAGALLERLEKAKVTELMDIKRKNVAF